jgi:DNA-binding protein
MVKHVNIGSEEIVDKNGKKRRVSSIEIILTKSRKL